MRMSLIPPDRITSASPTVATQIPVAPASSCIRATRRLLWVLACGRSSTRDLLASAAIRATLEETISRSISRQGVSRCGSLGPTGSSVMVCGRLMRCLRRCDRYPTGRQPGDAGTSSGRALLDFHGHGLHTCVFQKAFKTFLPAVTGAFHSAERHFRPTGGPVGVHEHLTGLNLPGHDVR